MADISDFIYINNLLEIYGKTLTTKQQEIMESYYVFNLSINEIAENLNISKAGVSDAMQVSVRHLENLEKIVGHFAYKQRVSTLLDNINKVNTLEEVKALIGGNKDGI